MDKTEQLVDLVERLAAIQDRTPSNVIKRHGGYSELYSHLKRGGNMSLRRYDLVWGRLVVTAEKKGIEI